jgi:Domain of unknown function (DUF4265)
VFNRRVSAGEDTQAELVKVVVEYLEGGEPKTEGLWAKPVAIDLFEIRNTPWFVYGINWGDVARCASLGESEVPRVLDVVETSGHRTLRLIFNREKVDEERQAAILARLNDMEAFYERFNDRFIALDVEPSADYEAVISFLTRLTDDDELIFEEAWRANDDGSFGEGEGAETQPHPPWLPPPTH